MKINNPAVITNTTGTYNGDGTTVNRAIAHGLGRVPVYVAIALGTGTTYFGIWSDTPVIYQYGAGGSVVTSADATNFYIGGASGLIANVNAAQYFWSAV